MRKTAYKTASFTFHFWIQHMPKRSQLFLLPLTESQRPRRLWVLLLLLLPLYLPFSWILLKPGPWDEKRMLWVKSWPALPGFVVQSLEAFDGKPIWASYAAMGVLTLLELVLLFQLGRTSRSSLFVAFALAAAFSSWNAWLAFQSY
jgi:hypothetical protein